MSVLPAEGDAVLSVHPDAVAARSVALQQLEAIAGWNHEIIKPGGGIEQFELPLDDSPQLTRHASGRTRVSLAKQIGCRLVAK
jgi:hypothetical protein